MVIFSVLWYLVVRVYALFVVIGEGNLSCITVMMGDVLHVSHADDVGDFVFTILVDCLLYHF